MTRKVFPTKWLRLVPNLAEFVFLTGILLFLWIRSPCKKLKSYKTSSGEWKKITKIVATFVCASSQVYSARTNSKMKQKSARYRCVRFLRVFFQNLVTGNVFPTKWLLPAERNEKVLINFLAISVQFDDDKKKGGGHICNAQWLLAQSHSILVSSFQLGQLDAKLGNNHMTSSL